MEIGLGRVTCLSQKDLAISLGLDKSNITRLVHSLEKSSFLKRVVYDLDKRVLLLDLTYKGKRFCRRLKVSSQLYIEENLSHVLKSKHQNLIDTLEELNRANTIIKMKRGKK